VMAASYAALTAFTAADHLDTAALIVVLGVGGLGWGITFIATLDHLSGVVTERGAADVSGLFQTTLRVGGTLGVAVFSTIYFAHVPRSDVLTGTPAFAATTLTLALTATGAALAALLALRDRPTPGSELQSCGLRR
jgi:hypothetical protein